MRWLLFPLVCPGGLFPVVALCAAGESTPEAPYATEADFLSDVPVVLSAARLQQPAADAPASITVIDRELIRAAGVIDLIDLLRLVPGMQVAHPSGAQGVATYHGLAEEFSRRLQVLVDGRAVYLPVNSSPDWSNVGVALDDIERVEVVQGSNAPAYGSNAFFGAINIVTRAPFQDRGIYARATAGSLDTRNVVLRGAGSVASVDYRVTGQFRSDDGFTAHYDGKLLRMLALSAAYTPDVRDTIEFQAGYSGGTVGVGESVGVDDADKVDPGRDATLEMSYGQVRWRHIVSEASELQFQYYHNRHDARDRIWIGPISEIVGIPPAAVPVWFGGQPDQLLERGMYDGVSKRDDAELQHTVVLRPDWRLVWGFGARIERYTNPMVYDRDSAAIEQSQRFFWHTEWRATPSWVFNAGAMTERNDVYGTHTSSRVAANHHVTPEQTLRFAASRAVRIPSLFETNVNLRVRFNDGQIAEEVTHSAEDLAPETLHSYELGYLGELPQWRVVADAKVYREYLDDLINPATDYTYPDPYSHNGALVFQNAGNVRTQGAEVRVTWRPRSDRFATVQYGYEEVTGRYFISRHPDRYEDASLHAPRNTWSVLGGARLFGPIDGSLGYYYVDAMRWNDIIDAESYYRFDARLAAQFTVGTIAGELALIVHNLTDHQYSDFRPENVVSRRTYLQVSAQF
jgi:iron complex outermembrane receptor protein